MYLGELAPKNMRGAIGIVPQLFITVGILSAQVLGIRNILGNSTGTNMPRPPQSGLSVPNWLVESQIVQSIGAAG